MRNVSMALTFFCRFLKLNCSFIGLLVSYNRVYINCIFYHAILVELVLRRHSNPKSISLKERTNMT